MMHVHRCPRCYKDERCNDTCSVAEDDEGIMRGATTPCERCRWPEMILLSVDTGASGAFAWDDGRGPRVRSLPKETRYLKTKNKSGQHKRRTYACHRSLERDIRRYVFGQEESERTSPAAHGVTLIALIEVSPPLPEQSAQATASQARTVGRIEATLAALGFTVYEATSREWRAHFKLRGGNTRAAPRDASDEERDRWRRLQAEAKRRNKQASRDKARELFARLVNPCELANTDRCEALLILRYLQDMGVETWRMRQKEQSERAKSKSPKHSKRLSARRALQKMRALAPD